MKSLKFKKHVIGEVINPNLNGAMNTFSTVGDVNGDGVLDVIVGGRNGKLVWFENQGEDKLWVSHLIDDKIHGLECGGATYDLTKNGCCDVIAGSDYSGDEVCWWENPRNGDQLWKKRLIAKTGFHQFHDVVFGKLDDEETESLLFTNQQSGGTRIFRLPIPDDVYQEPWPNLELIAASLTEVVAPWEYNKSGNQPEEGLAIGDIDGDGKNEIVCGTHWLKKCNGVWESHKFASDYIMTKVAIADVDGDGKNEIILSEGDPLIVNKSEGGKLAWFKPQGEITELWKETILAQNLLDAHSLKVGDLCGNGKMDIFCGEIGEADSDRGYKGRSPRVFVFENDGHANFTQHVIDTGTGIHDGIIADFNQDGKLDIMGKPLHGDERWNVHVYYNKTQE